MISESGFARAAAVVIPLQSARIIGQLAAGDALDVKALGVLAGDTAGIILALSSPVVLGPYWLVLLAFFVGSLFVSVAVVLPTRFNPGPPAADDDIAAVIQAGELRAYELLFNGMSEAVRHNAHVLNTKRRTLLVAFTLALEPILILLGIAALAVVHILKGGKSRSNSSRPRPTATLPGASTPLFPDPQSSCAPPISSRRRA